MPFFRGGFVRGGLAEDRSKPHDIFAVACFFVVGRAGFGILQPYISQSVGKPTVARLERIDCGYDFGRLSDFTPVKDPRPLSSRPHVANPQHERQSNRSDSKNEPILPPKN